MDDLWRIRESSGSVVPLTSLWTETIPDLFQVWFIIWQLWTSTKLETNDLLTGSFHSVYSRTPQRAWGEKPPAETPPTDLVLVGVICSEVHLRVHRLSRVFFQETEQQSTNPDSVITLECSCCCRHAGWKQLSLITLGNFMFLILHIMQLFAFMFKFCNS